MGLVPEHTSTLRLNQTPTPSQAPEVIPTEPGGPLITVQEAGGDQPEYDTSGNVVSIKHGDGSVTVSLDGKPIVPKSKDKGNWFRNLTDAIDPNEKARIVDDLLRAIEDDFKSRDEWMEDRAQGIRLLGFKIEAPGVQGSADGAPIEGMSRVRHPLLQEAVLRFQANARSELLPTDGPVKIRDDSTTTNPGEDSLANALEKDFNHYLTVTASEYYPDTDRMLLMLGFGGSSFKKIYFCPIRQRPVSESVDAENLIVNNSATDLKNAKRITHRVNMKASTVRRLQILGVYDDEDLQTPALPKYDPVQEEKRSQQGLSTQSAFMPDDRDREIYECYCELDIKGFEHKIRGEVTGLDLPYRVTIDKTSKKALSIVRNFNRPEGDDLPEANDTFVKYTFVPGLGFYDIGLLHILGNTTNALTAVWRELLDAGMFASFPGFLIAKAGSRQETNIFRVPPGGGKQVDTQGMPINQAVMPLPYKEPSPALMQMAQEMEQTGQRLGGVSEIQVGEGQADAPVGTTLAMIDQATKMLNSVHKRMHSAQAEEFRLLKECFKDHPESFWKQNKKPANHWDQETFLKAMESTELTPQADPNTASQVQRFGKVAAIKMLAAQNPTLYDPIAIDTMALNALGFSNPQQFFAPPEAQAKPTPDMMKMQAETQALTIKAQSTAMLDKAKAQELGAKSAALLHEAGKPEAGPEGPSNVDVMKAQAAMMDAQTRAKGLQIKRAEVAFKDANAQEDRQSKEKMELLQIGKEVVLHPQEAQVAEPFVKAADNTGSPKAPARKKRNLGGAVVDQDYIIPQDYVRSDTLKSVMREFAQDIKRSIDEGMNAEKEIVRDPKTGRVKGVRRKPRIRPEED